MCARCHPRLHPPTVLLVVVLFGVLVVPWANARLHAANPTVGEDQEPAIATDPSFRELKGRLLEGIPEFPAYPGATLIGSAERNKPGEKNRGYRIKWTTTDSPVQTPAVTQTPALNDPLLQRPVDSTTANPAGVRR